MAEENRDFENVTIRKVRYETYMAYPGPPAEESIQAAFTVDVSSGYLNGNDGSDLLELMDDLAVGFHDLFKAPSDPNYSAKLRRIMIPSASLESAPEDITPV